MVETLALKVDAGQSIQEIGAFLECRLQSAINDTVYLVKEADGHLAERLSRHLDDLLAEQLRQVRDSEVAEEPLARKFPQEN